MNEPQGYTQALADILNSKLAQDIMSAYDQGAKDKEDAIIKLLEAERDAANEQTVIRNVLNGAIALIKGDVTERLQTGMSPNGYTKGENKPKHTLCCDDWDCYGCEDCDCPDCLEGENK